MAEKNEVILFNMIDENKDNFIDISDWKRHFKF